MLSYIAIGMVVFLVGLFLVGKFNKKFHFYLDDEGRFVTILLVGCYSVFWPFSILLTILGVCIALVIMVPIRF